MTFLLFTLFIWVVAMLLVWVNITMLIMLERRLDNNKLGILQALWYSMRFATLLKLVVLTPLLGVSIVLSVAAAGLDWAVTRLLYVGHKAEK